MRYIVYLFYRYYNKGATIVIPYESAIFAVLFVLYINVIALMMLVDSKLTIKLFSDITRVEMYIYSSIGLAVGYLVISQLFPKKEVVQTNIITKNVKLHGWLLFFYCIISFVFLMFLIIKRRS